MIIITGGNGFIGSHLLNYLSFVLKLPNVYKLDREAFSNESLMIKSLENAEVIIHLAGLNRSEDEKFIYTENRKIVKSIIHALKRKNHYPRFINISSIHEVSKTPFGLAKRENREDLEEFYSPKSHKLISLITPNIFGPFCRPNYNSFVANFCYKLIRNEETWVSNDRKIDLLYVQDLIEMIHEEISSNKSGIITSFPITEIYTSKVFQILQSFKDQYLEKRTFPNIDGKFRQDLFNTFRSYIPYEWYPQKQIKHEDSRGFFSELIRTSSQSQFSISTSLPNIERGNHFHTRKIERFQILKGKARVELRKVGGQKIMEYHLNSENLDFIDIPIWHTHNLINMSNKEELVMLFWISEHYNSDTHDTYPLQVRL
jgi:UDP-2-acetamido-2,6-beta-L-arabino-hexul-4-ose reductase